MSDDLLVAMCSPTMAGIKTGSLFSCPMGDKNKLVDEVRQLNRQLLPNGICLVPLKYSADRALMYMYRPESLEKDLSDKKAQEILIQRRYPADRPQRCVCELVKRLALNDAFPHEIGLFLGYPPEDVHGFIENESHGAKLVGAWKVYGDEAQAKIKFKKYKECTELYSERYRRSGCLSELIANLKQ